MVWVVFEWVHDEAVEYRKDPIVIAYQSYVQKRILPLTKTEFVQLYTVPQANLGVRCNFHTPIECLLLLILHMFGHYRPQKLR